MSIPADVGFERPKTALLPGTVKFYQRHLLVCTGQSDWPGHIEESGGFIQALAQAIDAHATEMPRQVKLTACDEPSTGSGQDILIFPDQVRYTGLMQADVPAFVQNVLVNEGSPDGFTKIPYPGQHIFVCVHTARDPRCGACGPALHALLRNELARRDMADRVGLHMTSHVGGHEYAGNVLIYPDGDWYGYVTPDDVSRLIEIHILGGQIVVDRWRGRMGLTKEEQLKQVAEWQH